ncbi:MAG: cyclic nucleotide-binding domain-containing protein [Chloroflexi bacterium]|nr:cyclic nucleotide-binding domain-containing protein [Chloroflexota bacterium]
MKSPLVLAESVELLSVVFPGLAGQDYAELVERGEIRDYPADTVLCQEGRIEDVFYVIISGSVEVAKAMSPTDRRVLNRLGRHEFFGEMALVHSVPRVATVRTLEPTTVLEIYRKPFEAVLYRSPAMAVTVVREVVGRLRNNDQMTIGELRMKNEELAAAYRELSEQERLRTEFLTTISHELRTPLTSAKGYLQLIQTGVLKGEHLNGAFDIVGHNLDLITTLVNDILFLHEMEEIVPHFENLDLNAVVTHVVSANQQKAAANKVKLAIGLDPNLPSIQGSVESLSRVFNALLDNAIKFSPNGGEVQVNITQQGMVACVAVIDQGVGIPQEHMPKIFNKYFHLDEMDGHRFGGVGLGLAIAKHLVERHGGKIEVGSEVGIGTAFRVNLPIG